MKRVFKIAAILAGIAIIGCNRIDLVAPALISPADGAALYSGLAFIWGAGEEAEEYVIHVWTGSTDVIEDTLTDTTYTMSDSAFSALAYGIYNWAVASKADSKLEWSESWSFSLTQPGAPKLIAPQDSAVFDTEPPTFIWSSDSLEPDYVIRIFTDTTIDLQDTLADTTYTMSDSVFENLSNGTYNWQAGTVVFNGVLLSETRSFIVDKPPPPLDLDTTYFPFGREYEWIYEVVEWERDAYEIYDTVTIRVSDSSWNDYELFFTLEGGGFADLTNPVVIVGDKIWLRTEWNYRYDTVLVAQPETDTASGYLWEFQLGYFGDTLHILTYHYPDGLASIPYREIIRETDRVKGIGAVYSSRVVIGCTSSWGTSSRLLSFTTPQGQVWP